MSEYAGSGLLSTLRGEQEFNERQAKQTDIKYSLINRIFTEIILKYNYGVVIVIDGLQPVNGIDKMLAGFEEKRM